MADWECNTCNTKCELSVKGVCLEPHGCCFGGINQMNPRWREIVYNCIQPDSMDKAMSIPLDVDPGRKRSLTNGS